MPPSPPNKLNHHPNKLNNLVLTRLAIPWKLLGPLVNLKALLLTTTSWFPQLPTYLLQWPPKFRRQLTWTSPLKLSFCPLTRPMRAGTSSPTQTTRLGSPIRSTTKLKRLAQPPKLSLSTTLTLRRPGVKTCVLLKTASLRMTARLEWETLIILRNCPPRKQTRRPNDYCLTLPQQLVRHGPPLIGLKPVP